MIFYDAEANYGMFIFWRFTGSVLLSEKVYPMALFGALLGYIVRYLPESFKNELRETGAIEMFFSSISTGLAFLVVTRVSLAYKRFWDARGEFVQLSHFLLATANHMFAFVRLTGDEKDEERIRWKVHMCNLLLAYFAFAVSTLRGESAELTIKEVVAKYDIRLTQEEMHQMAFVTCRYHFIESLIVDQWCKFACANMIAVEAPLYSQTIRIISEMSDAVTGLVKIMNTPFPYPLAQTQGFMLHCFSLTVPLIVGLYITNMGAPIACFVSIALAFGLTRLSEEMEDPLGVDNNDLPLLHYLEVFRDCVNITLLTRMPISSDDRRSLLLGIKQMRQVGRKGIALKLSGLISDREALAAQATAALQEAAAATGVSERTSADIGYKPMASSLKAQLGPPPPLPFDTQSKASSTSDVVEETRRLSDRIARQLQTSQTPRSHWLDQQQDMEGHSSEGEGAHDNPLFENIFGDNGSSPIRTNDLGTDVATIGNEDLLDFTTNCPSANMASSSVGFRAISSASKGVGQAAPEPEPETELVAQDLYHQMIKECAHTLLRALQHPIACSMPVMSGRPRGGRRLVVNDLHVPFR